MGIPILVRRHRYIETAPRYPSRERSNSPPHNIGDGATHPETSEDNNRRKLRYSIPSRQQKQTDKENNANSITAKLATTESVNTVKQNQQHNEVSFGMVCTKYHMVSQKKSQKQQRTRIWYNNGRGTTDHYPRRNYDIHSQLLWKSITKIIWRHH